MHTFTFHDFLILRENCRNFADDEHDRETKGNVAAANKKEQSDCRSTYDREARLSQIGIAQPWATSWQDEKR